MKFLADGSQEVTLIPGRDYTIYIAGAFGGGTASLILAGPGVSGTLPMPGHEEITTGTAFVFTAPVPRMLVLLEGATSPDLAVNCILSPL